MASPAGGSCGKDVQQQLLSLIRGFATEKSQGERKVSGLRKRLTELQAELEGASAGLEVAKGQKVAAEHELKCSEVELSIADASVVALEKRTSVLREEVSKATSGFDAVKNESEHLQDEVINQMFELNKKIRHFWEAELKPLSKRGHSSFQSDDGCKQMQSASGNIVNKERATSEDMLKDVQVKITDTDVQLTKLKQKYQEELTKQDEIMQILTNMEKRAFLGEAIVGETKQLQELARQTAEAEKAYATLGAEIQKRFACPACGAKNMEVLEGTLPVAGGDDK